MNARNLSVSALALVVLTLPVGAHAGVREFTYSWETKATSNFDDVFYFPDFALFDPSWGQLTAATIEMDVSYSLSLMWDQSAATSGSYALIADYTGYYTDLPEGGLILPASYTDVLPPIHGNGGLPGTSGTVSSGLITLPTVSYTETNPEQLAYLVGVGTARAVVVDTSFYAYSECLSNTCGPAHVEGTAWHTMTIRYDYVPEPASWALMIAGFGLTGAAMRRSQKKRHGDVCC